MNKKDRKQEIFSITYIQKFRFTRDELRKIYRGFKNECPSGVLTEECFHYVYTSFFPGRDESYNGIVKLKVFLV